MATRCESAVCATTSYLQPICLRLRRFLTQHNRVRQLARVRDSRVLVRPLIGVPKRRGDGGHTRNAAAPGMARAPMFCLLAAWWTDIGQGIRIHESVYHLGDPR